METIQNEAQKEKNSQKKSISEPWNDLKLSDMCVIKIQKKAKREEERKIFGGEMAQNLPNLVTSIYFFKSYL